VGAAVARSRPGKNATTMYFDPQVGRRLKLVGIEQDMIAEALNNYFTKHGKSPIAKEAQQKKMVVDSSKYLGGTNG
jgi:hypothetical protein